MDDSLMGNSTSSFFPGGQNPNAFRRAPVMGNRGLESQRISQERSRSKPKSYSKDRASGGGSPRSGRRERRGGSASGSGTPSSGPVQVAALDERNLKRAVHRYGTLPKGARIGAYLESLRQSGMTPEPVTEQVTISGQFFFSSFSDKYLSRYFG
jgi:abelson tyrosine-protein kinase 1